MSWFSKASYIHCLFVQAQFKWKIPLTESVKNISIFVCFFSISVQFFSSLLFLAFLPLFIKIAHLPSFSWVPVMDICLSWLWQSAVHIFDRGKPKWWNSFLGEDNHGEPWLTKWLFQIYWLVFHEFSKRKMDALVLQECI